MSETEREQSAQPTLASTFLKVCSTALGTIGMCLLVVSIFSFGTAVWQWREAKGFPGALMRRQNDVLMDVGLSSLIYGVVVIAAACVFWVAAVNQEYQPSDDWTEGLPHRRDRP